MSGERIQWILVLKLLSPVLQLEAMRQEPLLYYVCMGSITIGVKLSDDALTPLISITNPLVISENYFDSILISNLSSFLSADIHATKFHFHKYRGLMFAFESSDI